MRRLRAWSVTSPGRIAIDTDSTLWVMSGVSSGNLGVFHYSSTGAPLNPASVQVTTDPTHGSVTCDATGKCTYTPNPNFSGTDTYQYKVCDTSTPTPVCSAR